jgi:hypothetical protein
MDFLSGGNGESAHAEKNGWHGAGPVVGAEADGALPGLMSHHGRAVIRWEKALNVTMAELGTSPRKRL